MQRQIFNYGEDALTIAKTLELASEKVKGVLNASTRSRIAKNQEYVAKIVTSHQTVYGINTGFGPLCTTKISDADLRQLQINLLKSHSVGVGPLVPTEIVKMMLVLKIHTLSKGYSGIAIPTIERLIWHLEHNCIPCVPSQGSVGASGDLAPLAHMCLPLIGLGEVLYNNEHLPAATVLKQHNLPLLELAPKEGLALINGTQLMAAYGVLITEKLQNCLDHADIIAAMHLEAMLGSGQPFREELHHLRPYAGSIYVAERMRMLLKDSSIMASHQPCRRVQDPYSLRCIPQVHGAARNAWLHLKEMLGIEINAVTDNPVVIDAHTIISGGHFHGQPLALPLDYVAIAAAEVGNISDRRIYLALEEQFEGLPKLLMHEIGLNSGFMIPQYTSAALVSENKSLCYPASADSIPTSIGQEDHVSMGANAAKKALTIMDNLEKILGIELFCAAQAFEFRRPLKSSLLLEACHTAVREKISFATKDRIYAEDIDQAIQLIKNHTLIKVTNTVAKREGLEFTNETHKIFGIY
jgi:histidine ammonia-lyase